MKIEDIIYDTTREVFNVEDKLRIATVFLFCAEIGPDKLSQLLYAKNHASFIQGLNREYAAYKVDFSVNFSNPNIKNAFFKTLEKVKEKWDSDGFYKAIADGDKYALAICQIVNTTCFRHDFSPDDQAILSTIKTAIPNDHTHDHPST